MIVKKNSNNDYLSLINRTELKDIKYIFNKNLIKAFTPIEKMIKRLPDDCYSRKLKEMINETNVLKDIA